MGKPTARTNDSDLVKYLTRIRRRTERHGNWRQVYLDCSGMCQYQVEDGIICGEVDTLEFHEIFGEAKNGESKFQQRVLICNYHHHDVHNGRFVNIRRFPSMLQFDVDLELKLAGSLANWIKKYKLIERSNSYDIKSNNRK